MVLILVLIFIGAKAVALFGDGPVQDVVVYRLQPCVIRGWWVYYTPPLPPQLWLGNKTGCTGVKV